MIAQVLQSSALILIVALGGLLSERSGMLNIGLEGMITIGAFAAAALAGAGLGALGAVAAGMAAGILTGLLFALFALRLQANPFIVGLAINLLAAGTAALLSEVVFATRGAIQLPAQLVPARWVVPAVALVLLAIVHVLLYTTPTGLHLRIAGEEPLWLTAHGLNPSRYRALALVLGGAAAGCAGALLALRVGVYLPNLSAGRGWIALVVIFLGYRIPAGLAAAALLFGIVEGLAVRAQAVLGVPPTILLALPYVVTVIAFVAYSSVVTRRGE